MRAQSDFVLLSTHHRRQDFAAAGPAASTECARVRSGPSCHRQSLAARMREETKEEKNVVWIFPPMTSSRGFIGAEGTCTAFVGCVCASTCASALVRRARIAFCRTMTLRSTRMMPHATDSSQPHRRIVAQKLLQLENRKVRVRFVCRLEGLLTAKWSTWKTLTSLCSRPWPFSSEIQLRRLLSLSASRLIVSSRRPDEM